MKKLKRIVALLTCAVMTVSVLNAQALIYTGSESQTDIDYIGANPDTSDWFEYNVIDDFNNLKDTALDMSRFLKNDIETYAGACGRVYADGGNFFINSGDEKIKKRFWGTNVVGQTLFMKTDEDMEELISALKTTGMNIVRIHHFDNPSMRPSIYGRWNTSDTVKYEITDEYRESVKGYLPDNFDEEILNSVNPSDRENFKYPLVDKDAMNRLCYLWARLREEGIYLSLTTIISMIPIDGVGITDYAKLSAGYKIEGQYDAHLIELQKAAAYQLFNWKNPYTGTTLGNDACVAMTEVCNEASLMAYGTSTSYNPKSDYYADELRELFNAWLRNKYNTDDKLIASWGTLEDGESIDENTVAIPVDFRNCGYSKNRIYDTYSFLADTETAYYDNIISYLRQYCGYDGLVTGGQSCQVRDLSSYYVNSKYDYIDRHGYYSHSQASVSDFMGIKLPYSSAPFTFKDDNSVGSNLFTILGKTAVYNRPSMISEWQWCEFNQFVGSGNFMMSAIAGYQGWNSENFCFFNGSLHEYGSNVAKSHELNSFAVVNHPFRMGTLPIASMMFHRNDVEESEREVYYTHKPNGAYGALDPTNGYPYSVGSTGYGFMFGKTGIQFSDKEICENPDNTIIADANRKTMPMINENGELILDCEKGMFEVMTDKTQGFTGFAKEKIVLEDVDYDVRNKYASVILSSLDDNNAISNSEHLLLSVATRTRNKGTVLADNGLSAVSQGDKNIIIVEPLYGDITIKNTSEYDVYELNADGTRNRKINTSKNQNGYTVISLDESNHALNYEIVRTSAGTAADNVQYIDMQNSSDDAETAKRYTSGKIMREESENLFAPDKKLTRGETIGIIARFFGLAPVNASSYTDVPEYLRDYGEVAAAKNSKIISESTKFMPYDAVTLDDAALWIYRALTGDTDLTDCNTAVESLTEKEILSTEDMSENSISRIKMVKILAALDRNLYSIKGIYIPGYTLSVDSDTAAEYEWYSSKSYDEEKSLIGTGKQYTLKNADGEKYIQLAVKLLDADNNVISVHYSEPVLTQKAISEQYPNSGWHGFSDKINKTRPDINSFKFGGRDFSVLEYENDGTVLVAANELYGTDYYTASTSPKSPHLQTFSNSKLGQTCRKLYENTACSEIKTELPEEIREYIKADAVWLTERGPNIDNGDVTATIKDDYTESSPIAVLSLHEIKKYAVDSNRLYVIGEKNEWTRTPVNNFSDASKEILYISPSGNVNGTAAGYSLGIRPVFRLKNEFFKNVKITEAGAEIYSFIGTLNTSEELENLGYEETRISQIEKYGDLFVSINNMTGTEITIDCANVSASEQNVTIIVGAYNTDGALERVELIPQTVPAYYSGRLTAASEDDINNNEKTKIFVWNNINEMRPLCDYMQY